MRSIGVAAVVATLGLTGAITASSDAVSGYKPAPEQFETTTVKCWQLHDRQYAAPSFVCTRKTNGAPNLRHLQDISEHLGGKIDHHLGHYNMMEGQITVPEALYPWIFNIYGR